jgi:DNA end-binding protein Ku
MPKSARSSKTKAKSRHPASRSMWSGSISFGLVSIPVGLYPAEVNHELSFKLLDKRDMTPVRYQRVNRDSGKQVAWDDIVRGFERRPGEMVVVTDEDLKRANVKATQTIEILDFVDAGAIAPSYFDRPYYIAPLQPKRRAPANPKAYVLLREALRHSGKIGIARVVIRTREHLAAVLPQDKVLILNLLRFDHELRKEDDLDLPKEALESAKVSDREMEMAERLIGEMTAKWQPERYKDDYRDDVLALIEKKAKAGEAQTIPEPSEEPPPEGPGADIIALLRKSLGGRGSTPANKVHPDEVKPRKAAPRRKAASHQRKAA